MIATYSIKKDELNANFFQSIKKMFKSERISIVIEDELDETERIMQNKSLYDKILKTSSNQAKNSVTFENNEFIG